MAYDEFRQRLNYWHTKKQADIKAGKIYEVNLYNRYDGGDDLNNPRFKSIVDARKYCISKNVERSIINIKSGKTLGVIRFDQTIGDAKNPWHVAYSLKYAWELRNDKGGWSGLRNLNRDGTISKSRGKKIVY